MNIIFDKSMPPIAEYKKILEERVSLVFSKIKYHNDQIKWIIFNPNITNISEDSKISDILEPFCTYQNGYNIGHSNPEKNEIYISSFAIECGLKLQNNSIIEMVYKYTNTSKKADLLDKVLLDELAHIKSQAKHGEKKYEDTIKSFVEAFYSNN